MRKTILFITALIFSMGTCSQSSGSRTQVSAAAGGQVPFEVKQSVFFSDGSLDEYTTFDWDAGYVHKINEKRFSASGAMLEQVEYAYNDAKGFMTTKLTRDVEERLKNRVVYQYSPQDLLLRESLVDNKGKVVSTYEYSYDARGNRISRVIKNRAGDRLAETIYTFDASGKMVTSETKDSGETTISSTRYTYDGQGNLVGQQVYGGDGQPTTRINAVWQNGLEVRNEMASAVDGTLQLRITNEYGQERELTKKMIDNFQGGSSQFLNYEYVFRPRR